MKKILFAAIAALSLSACIGEKADPNVYTIKGTATGFDGKPAYLTSGNDTLGVDTIKNGSFVFTGKVETPFQAYIDIDSLQGTDFYIEPGVINYDANNHRITGTPMNNDLMEIGDKVKIINEDINREGANVDSILDSYNTMIAMYLTKHAGDPMGRDLFKVQAREFSKSQIDSVLSLYPLYAQDEELKALSEMKGIQEKTVAGNPYIDISGVDVRTGKEFKLSDVIAKGKPVIVDFWASWCGPCRQEINEYLSKYAKEYKGKVNFIGIAVWERSMDDTKGAMRELPISWPVLFADGRGEETCKTYGIDGIPHIMLIGPDGTILARDIRGEKIKETIDKVLAE